LVLFVFSVITVAAATGAVADAAAGTLVRFEKSEGAISYTGGAGLFSSGIDGKGGASPFSIDSAGSATSDAALVCVGTTAGATAEKVTGALIRFGMSSDGAFL
jgi:hypothetical protein